MVLLNCAVDAVSVYPTYRKPFDMIFERALKDGGRDGIRTHDLLIANSGENKLRLGATIT
jgi:hypothetical protein